MPRPRIAIPFETILETYERVGSLRETELALGISRWALRLRFEEQGVPILDRDEVRRRRAVQDHHPAGFRERKRKRVLGGSGETVVTRIERIYFEPCVWPGCDRGRRHAGLCGEHWRLVSKGRAGATCRWPRCEQDASGHGDIHLDGRLCFYHLGQAEGRIQVAQ